MRRVFLATVIAALCAAAPLPAGAGDIASFKATYSVTITKPDLLALALSGGVIVVSQRETCDSWQLTFVMKMQVGLSQSNLKTIEMDSRTTETKSGEYFNFRSIEPDRDAGIKITAGSARLLKGEKFGRADFESPVKKTFRLPSDTRFPMRSLVEGIAQLRAGKKIFRQIVFEGIRMEGSTRSAGRVLGTPKRRRLADFDESLRSLPAWRVISYSFDGNEPDALVIGSGQAIIYANGITDIETTTTGGMELTLTPVDFERLPAPKCPQNNR